MGLAPLGCTPHYLWLHNIRNGECLDEIKNMERLDLAQQDRLLNHTDGSE